MSMFLLFQEDNISDMEKIDRIYSMLRSQQRSRRISLAIKLSIVVIVAYGYHYLTLPEHADVRANITQSLQTQLSAIVTPMVESMVGDMTANMVGGSTTSTGVRHRNIPSNTSGQLPANITPEMIRAVQESMKKSQ